MGIEVSGQCDACRAKLGDGDDIICVDCHQSLEQELQDAKDRVEELEAELEKLQDLNDKCSANCSACTERYDCVSSSDKKVTVDPPKG